MKKKHQNEGKYIFTLAVHTFLQQQHKLKSSKVSRKCRKTYHIHISDISDTKIYFSDDVVDDDYVVDDDNGVGADDDDNDEDILIQKTF